MQFKRNVRIRSTIRTSTVILVGFFIHYWLDYKYFQLLRTNINTIINEISVSHYLAYVLIGIPLILILVIFLKPENLLDATGLSGSFFRAVIFALTCTIPMFLGFAVLSDFNVPINARTIWISVIAAAFFEELYFRAFLFGLLFRRAKWGFIPAAAIGAILFGLVHLYQGNNLNEAIGVFFVTFLGAGLFAWVYVEWNYNLWVPIFLHLFMNLSWEMFSAADNALGGIWPNIFRSMTIALIIMATIRIKKRKKENLAINKTNMLSNPSMKL